MMYEPVPLSFALRTLQASRHCLAKAPSVCRYHFVDGANEALKLLEKYIDVLMSFADAGLVRMPVNDPMLLTTDPDFHILPSARPGGHSKSAVALKLKTSSR
jgi:hypothetical protein